MLRRCRQQFQQLLLIGGERRESNGAALRFSDVWALDATTVADVTVLGPGCGSPAGQPSLVPGYPHPGAPAFAIDLRASAGAAPCLFLFGAAQAPLPLGAGCTSYVTTPWMAAFALTGANDMATMVTDIPLAQQGFAFVTQAAVLDPLAPLGLVVTDGLRITVGR